MSALLTELAAQAERQAIFRAEREASHAETTTQAVRDEDREWEGTVGDGPWLSHGEETFGWSASAPLARVSPASIGPRWSFPWTSYSPESTTNSLSSCRCQARAPAPHSGHLSRPQKV